MNHIEPQNDFKKYLPSTFSTVLIWSLPCVTISAVLDAVEIISEYVVRYDAASEAALRLFLCLLSLWGVVCFHPSSPTAFCELDYHTHINSHLDSNYECQQVTWTIESKQPLFGSIIGMLEVQLLYFSIILLYPRPVVWHLLSAGYE